MRVTCLNYFVDQEGRMGRDDRSKSWILSGNGLVYSRSAPSAWLGTSGPGELEPAVACRHSRHESITRLTAQATCERERERVEGTFPRGFRKHWGPSCRRTWTTGP